MNADHADSIQHYAETLLGRTLRAPTQKTPQWLITGVDAEDCDLRRGASILCIPWQPWKRCTLSWRVWLGKRGNKVLKNFSRPLIQGKIYNNCCLEGFS